MTEPTLWILKRLDDNGQEVEVRRYASREEAERAAQELEQRAHKQTYWVEPAR